MAYGTVDTLVAQFKGAISEVVLAEEADAQDVMFALKKLTKEWVMPEKIHEIPAEPLPGEGEGGGGTPDPVTITGVDPASTEVGVAADVTVTGTGFTESSMVQADGNGLVTTFVSATELTAAVPGPLQAGTVNLTVDGSAPFAFEVTEPAARRTRR